MKHRSFYLTYRQYKTWMFLKWGTTNGRLQFIVNFWLKPSTTEPAVVGLCPVGTWSDLLIYIFITHTVCSISMCEIGQNTLKLAIQIRNCTIGTKKENMVGYRSSWPHKGIVSNFTHKWFWQPNHLHHRS